MKQCDDVGMLLRAAIGLLLVAWAFPVTAHASYPGANGRIVYSDRSGTSYTGGPQPAPADDLLAGKAVRGNPSPTHHRNLTRTGERFFESQPAGSPNGRRIVFVGSPTRYSSYSRSDLFSMPADGSRRPENLTRGFNLVVSSPAFAPNGRVVFAAHERDAKLAREQADLYVLDLKSQAITELVVTPGADEQNPSVSPDGRTVLFDRRSSDVPSLYTVGLDEPGDPQKLPVVLAGDSELELYEDQVSDGDFTPDGSRIVFEGLQGAEIGFGTYRNGIYLADADGGNVQVLHELDKSSSAGPDPYVGDPVVSPDGERVAFTGGVYGGSTIRVLDISTGSLFPFDHRDESLASDFDPTWLALPMGNR
jgi:Tol biopolymer transport system component